MGERVKAAAVLMMKYLAVASILAACPSARAAEYIADGMGDKGWDNRVWYPGGFDKGSPSSETSYVSKDQIVNMILQTAESRWEMQVPCECRNFKKAAYYMVVHHRFPTQQYPTTATPPHSPGSCSHCYQSQDGVGPDGIVGWMKGGNPWILTEQEYHLNMIDPEHQ